MSVDTVHVLLESWTAGGPQGRDKSRGGKPGVEDPIKWGLVPDVSMDGSIWDWDDTKIGDVAW